MSIELRLARLEQIVRNLEITLRVAREDIILVEEGVTEELTKIKEEIKTIGKTSKSIKK